MIFLFQISSTFCIDGVYGRLRIARVGQGNCAINLRFAADPRKSPLKPMLPRSGTPARWEREIASESNSQVRRPSLTSRPTF